jgi:DNA repair photolyase
MAVDTIEPLFYRRGMRPTYRDEPCRTALNRVRNMSFSWSLNPYMGCAHQCTFCFVRAFERLADRPSDGRYGTSIRVKTNFVEVLTRELARKSWRREQVAIGTATDPYQPAEGRFRLTRGSIVALGEARTPFGLITRGPLIVRDVDVLSAASVRAKVGVTFSIPTLDHEIWRLTEPGTAPPRQRLRAIRTLIDAGIDASVGMAPILPGISDDPAAMATVVRAARDAGATSIWANVLYLKPGTREHFLENLARDWPELLPRYESLYAGRAYVESRVVKDVRLKVRELTREHGVADRRERPLLPEPEPSDEQLPLTAFIQANGETTGGGETTASSGRPGTA